MKSWSLLAISLVLAGCSAPEPSGVKVIVGAKLAPAAGQPAIEYSVIVIADGKIRAVGPQATTPVPKGSEITSGMGRVITDPLEIGKPADLVLRDAATGSVEATMKNGEWVK